MVTGYSWAGIRADNFEETVRFFERLFGFSSNMNGENIALFKLPSGQKFEIIGPDSPWAAMHKRPVIAFDVEDIYSARQDLKERGITFLTEIKLNGTGGAFFYFVGPEGLVYSLSQKTPKESGAVAANREGSLGRPKVAEDAI